MLKDTDFTRGISLEEDSLENEQPDEIKFYDLVGNEVTIDDAK